MPQGDLPSSSPARRQVYVNKSGPPAAAAAAAAAPAWGRVSGVGKPRRQGAAVLPVAPPPGREPWASELRATAFRASTCARPRRRPPDPGATARAPRRGVGGRNPGSTARRLPHAPCPRGAGAAAEARFVCAARAGMPGREWSPRPTRERAKAEPAVKGAKDRKAPSPRGDVGSSRTPPPLSLSPSEPPPPAPRLRSPALRDPRASAHRRSATGGRGGRHARPGLDARVTPGRLQEGFACRPLPCAPGGGRRCRGSEEGEREPQGEGTGREGAPGALLQPQPEAARAP